MARMTLYPADDFMNQLNGLGNKLDEVAPTILKESIQPLKRQIIKNASKHVDTGGMVSSIKEDKPKKTKTDAWIQNVIFHGYDKTRKPTPSFPRGIPHALKAMVLEYGSSKQQATPFIRPAVAATEKEVTATMQQVFDREANKL